MMLCGNFLASPEQLTDAINIDTVIMNKTMAWYFDRTHIAATREKEA